ncbi:MAG: PIG-L family deacetylase [Leptospiraceae bacterium]|nr:PIG-L family deacetylase [Leptospiraceae bacterium]
MNKTKLTIACVGAHPDDVELSMGGTVLRMKEAGHEVILVDLSNGEPTPYGSVETRKTESENSANLLGVKRIQLDFPNRYIEDSISNKKRLAEVFREIKCDYIFTHYEYDSHPDHGAACKLTEAARFYSKLTKSDIKGEPFYPYQIIYYFPNHIRINLKPSFCVDVSPFVEKKREALNCYESQFIKKGNGKMIEDTILLNSFYGLSINCNYAEPFYIREALDILKISSLFR